MTKKYLEFKSEMKFNFNKKKKRCHTLDKSYMDWYIGILAHVNIEKYNSTT